MSGFLDHLMKGLERRKRPVLVLIEEANKYCSLSTPRSAKRIPQGAGAPFDIDALASMILPKVLERLPALSGVGYVPARPAQSS
jgi:hypothetical protein